MNGLALLSGGLDSVTMLHEFAGEIGETLAFDYGSKHNRRELPFALHHAQALGKHHRVVELPMVADHFRSDLLRSGGEIPEGHYTDPQMRRTVVPFRNGIMLAFAVGLAESIGLKQVYIANHFGDHAIYPDCRTSFFSPFREAAREGTYERIEVIAPYLHLTKRDIAMHGAKLGIDLSKTWSCYKGGELHCGVCGTCVERREALVGFDPTDYEGGEVYPSASLTS